MTIFTVYGILIFAVVAALVIFIKKMAKSVSAIVALTLIMFSGLLAYVGLAVTATSLYAGNEHMNMAGVVEAVEIKQDYREVHLVYQADVLRCDESASIDCSDVRVGDVVTYHKVFGPSGFTSESELVELYKSPAWPQ